MLKYLFLFCFLWYGWALFYESFFLPFVSQEIPVNGLKELKNFSISSMTIYDNKNAYITLNTTDVRKIGQFNIGISKIYFIKLLSVDKFYKDISRYYGDIGDDVEIYYKEFTNISVSGFLLLFLLFLFLRFITSLRMSDDMGGLFGKVVGSEKEFNLVKDEKTRLVDVAGCSEVKEEVLELVDMIKNPVGYLSMGARLPKGALLTGPPGTGKTLMAKAIAGECGFSFLSVSGSDFNEILVGMGSSRIRKLFQKARENRPCIVFIDEIDAVASKRVDKMQQKDDKDNTLNALLVEMDGFGNNDGVVVIGATNRMDVLDPAILRAGRFDRKIHFGYPDKNDREEIFSYYFGKVNWLNKKDIDDTKEKIVNVSYGLTGADVSNLVNEGVIMAVKEGRKGVVGEDMMRALEYVLCGKEKKNYFMTDIERKVVAYHESGHALMGWILKGCSVPVIVSIIPTGKSALGYTLRENEEIKLRTKEAMLGEIGMMLGGRLAEEIFIGEITTGASDDFKKAIEQAKSMVVQYNFFMDEYVMNEGCCGEQSKDRIDETATKIVNTMYKIGKERMEQYKDNIELMVERLMRDGKLEGDKIGEIFREEIRDVVILDKVI